MRVEAVGCRNFYLTESIGEVVFNKSIPPQIRRIVQVDGSVRGFTFASRLHELFL